MSTPEARLLALHYRSALQIEGPPQPEHVHALRKLVGRRLVVPRHRLLELLGEPE